MTGNNERQSNNISTYQWLEHFEALFNDGAHHDTDGNEIDIALDEPSDEVEDHLFNSKIADEELLTAIRSMHKGKATGQDSIISEVFIFWY